ncbi:glycosyltransferase family 9 protein [Halobacteriovorax sp. JY17]|uniref:glycosyltransferase family 9 protein n=1 Tax=Halobacteriovorax sp. JY17 TaxID=2014617 RepID=UPI000C4DD4B9|nr:glycosyltransferase family 9 protein [Halobacteriovorax sp. JY17]PIK16312.1 MAG: glycosyl transferase 9 [Halobacteriovorax sp. JY17]
MNKTLIIRFSSFGDIVQCMSVLNKVKENIPGEIHWVTRADMSSLLLLNKSVDKIWSFEKEKGIIGLIRLALALRRENYSHVYDAHSNLRSRVISLFLFPPNFLRRSKERMKRLLLFTFRKNLFDNPYRGIISYLRPLRQWGIKDALDFSPESWSFQNIELSEYFEKNSIVIAPSAAWEMKRWPISHWKKLIELNPNESFTILGGPGDRFCEDIRAVAPERVFNLAGKLSLIESCYIVNQSKLLISADTGLIHVADILGRKGISLMGPTAFGFATGKHIKTLEVELSCRPCTKDGRGSCSQDTWQKCMVDITPERVTKEISSQLSY